MFIQVLVYVSLFKHMYMYIFPPVLETAFSYSSCSSEQNRKQAPKTTFCWQHYKFLSSIYFSFNLLILDKLFQIGGLNEIFLIYHI